MEDTSGIDFAHTWASNDFAKPMLSMLSAFARLERDRIAECIRDAIFR
jgi:DNA invertase Pin-like site-specific DNA recombinase